MDQEPLPRGSLQVVDRLAKVLDAVPKLAETAVAVEAEYSAYGSGAVGVVDGLGVRRAADRAEAALLGRRLRHVHPPDPRCAAAARRAPLTPRVRLLTFERPPAQVMRESEGPPADIPAYCPPF